MSATYFHYCKFSHCLFLFVFWSPLVELPSPDAHVEVSAGPELWKHCGDQTGRADPTHCAAHWITDQRGLIPKLREYYLLF